MFYVGERVLCIDDSTELCQRLNPGVRFANDSLDGLTAGEVYTIASIYYTRDVKLSKEVQDMPHLVLREIKRTAWSGVHTEDGFLSIRFRKLNDSAVDVFKKMCRDIDLEVRIEEFDKHIKALNAQSGG